MNDATKREILKFVSAANPGDTRLVEIDGVVYRIEAVGRQSTSDDESKRCENCGLRGTLAPDADECPCLESCLVDDAYGAGLDFNVWRLYEKPEQDSTKGKNKMEKETIVHYDETPSTPPKIRNIATFAAANYCEGFKDAKLETLEMLGKIRFKHETQDGNADDEHARAAEVAFDMVKLGMFNFLANLKPSRTFGGFLGELDDADEDAENDSAADAENEERAENEKLVAAFGGPVVEGTDADVVAGSETPVRGCDPGQPGYYELTPENCIGEIGVIGPTGPETNGANENEL